MRIPKAAEIGLGEELPKIASLMREDGIEDGEIVEQLKAEKHKGVSRYDRGKKIGGLIQDANKQLLLKARNDLNERTLARLRRKQEIDNQLKQGGIWEKKRKLAAINRSITN